MGQLLVRLDRGLARLELGVCVLLMALIIVVTGWGVFSRYVLNMPLIWGSDVGILAMVWLTFLGASVLFRENGHISASTLAFMLPAPAALALRIASELIVAGAVVVAGWYAVSTALVQSGQMITSLQMPRSLYSIPIIWMAATMVVCILVRVVQLRTHPDGQET